MGRSLWERRAASLPEDDDGDDHDDDDDDDDDDVFVVICVFIKASAVSTLDASFAVFSFAHMLCFLAASLAFLAASSSCCCLKQLLSSCQKSRSLNSRSRSPSFGGAQSLHTRILHPHVTKWVSSTQSLQPFSLCSRPWAWKPPQNSPSHLLRAPTSSPGTRTTGREMTTGRSGMGRTLQ